MDTRKIFAALLGGIDRAVALARSEPFFSPEDAPDDAPSPHFSALIHGLLNALFLPIEKVATELPLAFARLCVYVMHLEELARESLAFDFSTPALLNQEGTKFDNGKEIFISSRAERLISNYSQTQLASSAELISKMAELKRELTAEEIASSPTYAALDRASYALYRHVARLERRLLELERREAVRVDDGSSTVSRIEEQDPSVEITNVVEPERDVLLVFPEGADVAAFRLPRDEPERSLVLGKSDLYGKTWTRVSLLLQSAGSPDVVRAVALFGPVPAGEEPVGMISAKLCLEHGVHVRGACGFEEKPAVCAADARVVLFDREPDPARLSTAVKLELVETTLDSAPESDEIATLMREAASPLGGTFSGLVS